ncbi:hypothetical protein AAFC00_004245 [Neodothiora populina]|uniref:Uncharacterized protein n=1 Tax=Neodothiora populina TaxID=2781224 RepID=A0ABR3PJ18_9PEZI
MFRPTPSKLCVTTADIQDLKSRIARRPTELGPAQGTDWFTVQASQPSQNSKPPVWHKGILRPSPRRPIRGAISCVNPSHAHVSPQFAPFTDTSSELEEDTLSDTQLHDRDVSSLTVAESLAEARRAIDAVDANRDQTAASSRSSLNPRAEGLSHRNSGHSYFDLPLYTSDNSGLEGDGGLPPRLDGSSEMPYRSRGGHADDSYYDSTSRNLGLPDECGLPHLPRMMGHDEAFTLPTSLDPMAPSFIPRIKFGSADDPDTRRAASYAVNNRGAQSLRPRNPILLDPDNSQLDPASSYAPRTRAQRSPYDDQQPQRDREYQRQRPSSLGRRSDLPASLSGIVIDRYLVMKIPGSCPSPLSTSSPTALPSEREMLSHDLSPIDQTDRQYSRDVPDARSRPIGARRSSARLVSSIGSHSVPDLFDPSLRASMIHSRHSSLSWDRPASSNGISEPASPGRNRIRRDLVPPDAPLAPNARRRYPSQAYYLNHSPLDELTAALQQFSSVSTDRHSSNSLQPFRGRLLSGGLGCSEDSTYDEGGVGSDEDEEVPPVGHVSDSRRLETLPALIAPASRAREPTIIASSTPLGLTGASQHLASRSPSASSVYSVGSIPLPDPLSPARMSPLTSGPTYSLPTTSMPPAPPSSSPPHQDLPSGPQALLMQSTQRRTPPRRGALTSPIVPSGLHARPGTTPSFRIYDDELPAARQPQTPADVSRWRPSRPPAAKTPNPVLSPASSLETSSNRRSYPASTSAPWPRLEPSTAELTAIPFMSPRYGARRTLMPPRQGQIHPSVFGDRENKVDIDPFIALGAEREGWHNPRAGGSVPMRRNLPLVPLDNPSQPRGL